MWRCNARETLVVRALTLPDLNCSRRLCGTEKHLPSSRRCANQMPPTSGERLGMMTGNSSSRCGLTGSRCQRPRNTPLHDLKQGTIGLTSGDRFLKWVPSHRRCPAQPIRQLFLTEGRRSWWAFRHNAPQYTSLGGGILVATYGLTVRRCLIDGNSVANRESDQGPVM